MKDIEERIAKHGEKMIEVRVRFWTDGIAKDPKMVRPKHAWDSGVVAMGTNGAHGLKQHSPVPFNSILELSAIMAKLLVREGVVLHANDKLSKLIT